jgi:hypothetical protein
MTSWHGMACLWDVDKHFKTFSQDAKRITVRFKVNIHSQGEKHNILHKVIYVL